MTYLAALTADWHETWPGAWSTRPSICGDSFVSLAAVIDWCIEQQCPLFALGDLFDKQRPDPYSVQFVYGQMERMAKARLNVYYTQGQHEYNADHPWMQCHPWPQWLHKRVVGLYRGPIVYGLDWTPPGQIAEAWAEIPPTVKILATHQVWREYMGGLGVGECSFADVPHVQTVWTGDYHVPRIDGYMAADGRGGIQTVSPGSLAMQAVNEPPEKGFWGVRMQDGQLVYDWVRVPCRSYYGHDVRSEVELDNLIDSFANACFGVLSLPELIRKPIMRVTYPDTLPNAYRRLTAAVGDRAHLFTKVESTVGETVIEMPSAEEAFDDLSGAVGQLNSAVAEDCRRLLNAIDPAAELVRMEQDYFARTT